ncbi:MAG: hypothetical protein IPM15_12360 [Betaproteobacteria bacterium]|nr:hypothetical protein [Betaproteobacteria bacterium]MCC6246540.1 hypothetical protein [Rubrivivax sp.]MCL4695693.1 hypothetical protein [Burkholderiaceae bacterium]
MPGPQHATARWPLWPLALLAGLLPIVATVLAWALSTAEGLIPACVPFVDGCVSVSRAARHGLANHLFRALVLPAAVLQGLCWLLAARWLATMLPPYRLLAALAPLGIVVSIALVAYGAFLGTEGEAYRWLRRWGTIVYFGGTCVCLLIAGGGVQRAVVAGRLALARWVEHAMVALALSLVALGLGHALLAAFLDDEAKGRLENITEWWAALIFMLGFFALAIAWRRVGLAVRLGSD